MGDLLWSPQACEHCGAQPAPQLCSAGNALQRGRMHVFPLRASLPARRWLKECCGGLTDGYRWQFCACMSFICDTFTQNPFLDLQGCP